MPASSPAFFARSLAKPLVLAAFVTGAAVAGAVSAGAFNDHPDALGKKYADEMFSSMQDPAAMEAAMAKWIESAQPGVAHDWLAAFAGDWDITMTLMMSPTGQPTVTKGTATSEVIMDGRYVRDQLNYEMMQMPVTGMGITGYNNIRKQFQTTWLDNLGTGMMTMTGNLDREGKILTMVGEMDEPMTGEM
ncbi:MAG: DUF1579 family protein, partial [Planctomycetota bacterium]